MASNRNNSGTPIEAGVIARLTGAIRYAVTGKEPDWFSPLKPLDPVAPPEVAGRQYDYQFGQNLNYKPRSGEAVSFSQMRALADNLDILRIVIETRKDQMAAQKWTFKLKDESKKPDQRCQELIDFFQSPDKEHTWDDWLRMILEDLFVLDAPAIYPRKTKGGEIYSFEPLDGSTITRLIDSRGRTPMPPEPAYQQVLKGFPAVDYTFDELVYKPRNLRTHKLYGYSNVEQIIMTVNIAIRRSISQLSYYTDGSTPDLIFSTPESWNPNQIKEFKELWDAMLGGNLQGRRGSMFIPAGVAPVNTKDQILKDLYDEWLARIVCFCFSIPPTAFIKDNNRATAETSQESARMEGLLPLRNWVRDTVNLLVFRYFGYSDITFSWVDDAELDPLTKAQVDQIYLSAKVVTADEVRHKSLSMPPLTPEQKDELSPPVPEPVDPIAGDDPAKKSQAPTVRKIKKILPINRNRQAVAKPRAALKRAIQAAFAKSLNAVVAEVTKSESGLITKGKTPEIGDESLEPIDGLGDELEKALVKVAASGATAGFAQINYNVDDALKQANVKAVDWARNRAAELVGKRIDENGNIIDNPNAEYRISDTTRDGIKSLVTQAENEGWTNAELADALKESYAFSDERADMIARTETAFADASGNMIAYKESGVVKGKKWLLAPDSCDICNDNADQGVIPLEDTFKDGSDTAPAHPRCVCDCAPVVGEDE